MSSSDLLLQSNPANTPVAQPTPAPRGARWRAVIVIALCLTVFALMALAVGQGWTAGLDEAVLRALRSPTDLSDPWGPPWFEDIMIDYTVLGGYTFLATLAVVLTVGLLVLGHKTAALFVIASVASGTAVAQMAKAVFDRARPDLVDHLDRTATSSFPSAHATVSMVAYLALALALLAAVRRPVLRAYIIAMALGLSFIVGISRVYLGVHWPSDVLAGWSLGAAWAVLCWLVADIFDRRIRSPDHVAAHDETGGMR